MPEQVVWISFFTLCVTILSGLCMPFVLRSLKAQDTSRAEMKAEMHERLTHLDNCVDDLRDKVIGHSVSREDLILFRAETGEALNRMRSAISIETDGLHQRIYRIENLFLNATKQHAPGD